ncbi:hypothetical protein SLS62_010874 [Diatrype stigma]|uniref:Uncharacterized protein n=1 Tax=Diatrype stigma TaxID=117547 RepID=A0AAN9YH76_9PEZI
MHSAAFLPGVTLADFGQDCKPACQPPEECTWHCKYDCGPTLDETVCTACIYLTIEGSHCTSLKIDGSDKIGKEMCDACWSKCHNSNEDICTSYPVPTATATATATGLPRASGFMRDIFS